MMSLIKNLRHANPMFVAYSDEQGIARAWRAFST